MGVPKQKWTAEEEAALKAGVVKHGAGKWRTILTDREFSSILSMRSNVDLKDKWRNINVTEIWGSRHNAKLAFKYNLPPPKIDNNHMALSTLVQRDKEVADFKPLAVSGGTCPNSMENTSRLQDFQLDNLIFESITKLKEPRGSDRESIAAYIEVLYLNSFTYGPILFYTNTQKLIGKPTEAYGGKWKINEDGVWFCIAEMEQYIRLRS
ncbi:hypothetical protein Fmac_002304 [Flemingia macrophylla]|uniref:MYB transcription factor n=1 Tax=Flemingia macrophylla TaxID=520843 RepID=A0ABD1NJK8_9FABA